MANITSANIVLVLGTTDTGLIPLGTVIKAFAPDTAVSSEAKTTGEVQVGVDGTVYAGWIPQLNRLTIHLAASSDSNKILEGLITFQNTARRLYKLVGTYVVPASNTAYALTDGYLTAADPLPTAANVLKSREYTFTFGGVTPVPIPDEALTAVASLNG